MVQVATRKQKKVKSNKLLSSRTSVLITESLIYVFPQIKLFLDFNQVCASYIVNFYFPEISLRFTHQSLSVVLQKVVQMFSD